MARLNSACGVLVGGDWLPTAENINALPEPLRLYIAGLETLCDPAGIVRENTLLKDCNKGLQAMYRKAVDAGVPVLGQQTKDKGDADGGDLANR